ncbi:MAG: DUF1189 family protein [Candidatus Peribacter sp.]|nr:DUF1189 family protein [Candidatus Peribacter sp.]
MKHFLRTFFLRVWTSIAHPSRYRDFQKESFWASVRYLYWLLTLTVFATMLTVLIGFFFSLPHIRQGVKVFERDLPTLYPAELVVTLKDGKISTNVQEPYFIDLPPRWQEFLRGQEGWNVEGRETQRLPEHFITINTKAGVENYDPEQSLILITRSSVVMPDKNSSYRVFTLEQARQDFTMKREIYDQLVTAASPFVRAIPSLLAALVVAGFLLLPFVGSAFAVLGYLLYLLCAVLLVWIIAAVMSRKAGYGTLYRLSLTALTAPILIIFVANRIGLSFPFFFSLLYLGWMMAIVRFLPRHTARLRAGNAGVKSRKNDRVY